MNATNWRVPLASASFARLYSPAGHLTMPNSQDELPRHVRQRGTRLAPSGG